MTMPFERVGSLSLLRFPARDLRVFAATRDGLQANQSQPTTGLEALRMTGAYAALDGPMFARCDSGLTGTDAQRYAQSNCSRVEYLLYDEAAGLLVQSRYPTRGATLAVVDGVPTMFDGAVVPAGATVAVQGYPEVIRGGRVVANPTSDTDRVVRAGVGIDREGLVVFVVGVGSMYGFGQGALAAGLVELVYTDGGGSGRAQLEDAFAGSAENRRVGSWLLAMRGGSSGESGGSSALGWIALGVAGAGAWWLWRRQR